MKLLDYIFILSLAIVLMVTNAILHQDIASYAQNEVLKWAIGINILCFSIKGTGVLMKGMEKFAKIWQQAKKEVQDKHDANT